MGRRSAGSRLCAYAVHAVWRRWTEWLLLLTRFKVFAFLHYGILFKAIAQGLGASISLIEPTKIVHAAKVRRTF